MTFRKPKKLRTKAAKQGRRNRVRGHRHERLIAKRFNAFLGLSAQRGIGQARSAGEVADVKGVPHLWVECKHRKALSVREALRQAEFDRPEDLLPVAIYRFDRKKDMVAMYSVDFRDVYAPYAASLRLLKLRDGNFRFDETHMVHRRTYRSKLVRLSQSFAEVETVTIKTATKFSKVPFPIAQCVDDGGMGIVLLSLDNFFLLVRLWYAQKAKNGG